MVQETHHNRNNWCLAPVSELVFVFIINVLDVQSDRFGGQTRFRVKLVFVKNR